MLTLAIVIVLLIGHTQPLPDNIALLHLNICTRPCWIGITPGVNTLGELKTQLAKVFPEPVYTISTPDSYAYSVQDTKHDVAFTVLLSTIDHKAYNLSIIDRIQLVLYQDWTDNENYPAKYPVALGQMVLLWGSPNYINMEYLYCWKDWILNYGAGSNLYLNQQNPERLNRLDWNRQVEQIFMDSDETYLGSYYTRQWQGFSSYEKYSADYIVDCPIN
jgi:hypothetical protein